ncbi:DUF554 domain-containing protein [Microcella humidisoli]|uniref:DUF554 domain-containing protein n=1 Tax=Microcella humidisoli TaxID=2963406 RepID=A0ABY5G038_9MICO|nr:DUF554 domain-containing protein [Microcella humidisoli]UTT63321.1 DUF554 domain-containing protein [Microcella humidisoli]
MIVGLGTLLNVTTIVVGAAIGVLIGNRLPERTNRVVTDALGLITIVLGGLNLVSLTNSDFVGAVGAGGTFLVVIGALLIGSIVGSLAGIERRLEGFGGWLQDRLTRRGRSAASVAESAPTRASETADSLVDARLAISPREKFINGFVDASLVFAIGPLAILGAFQDGTGQGIDQLALKSTLDGFASIAFAASLGWGVAFSAIPVGIWQGLLTVLAFALGSVMSGAAIAALTATGGVLLLGVGLRLLNLRAVAVADMLPALIVAPLLTVGIAALLGN